MTEPVKAELSELDEWSQLVADLKVIKAKEVVLRKKLYASNFTNPNEGTNNLSLGQGWTLQGKYNITRTVDEQQLRSMDHALQVAAETGGTPTNPVVRLFQEHRIVPESVVTWKPSLNKRAYNKLSDDQKAVFDNLLTVKDGMPGLVLVYKEPTDDEIEASSFVEV